MVPIWYPVPVRFPETLRLLVYRADPLRAKSGPVSQETPPHSRYTAVSGTVSSENGRTGANQLPCRRRVRLYALYTPPPRPRAWPPSTLLDRLLSALMYSCVRARYFGVHAAKLKSVKLRRTTYHANYVV